MFTVIKQDGMQEEFSREKLRESLRRSGVATWLVDEITHAVEDKFARKKKVPTEKIYAFVKQRVQKKSKNSIPRYTMKRSLLTLGPTGFPFEQFLAKVFEAKGYQTRTGQILQGKCVTHEMDIVAWDEHELLFIEVKFHNQLKIRSDTKTALYIKARMDDLADTKSTLSGSPQKMTQGVLITNTKFTSSALKYGLCAGIDMISFDYPQKGNLYDLVEETGLHPLTCLTELSKGHKKKLLDQGYITCKVLADDPKILDKLNMNPQKKERILDEINTICYHTKYDESQRRS
jgi:hypothetical protein